MPSEVKVLEGGVSKEAVFGGRVGGDDEAYEGLFARLPSGSGWERSGMTLPARERQ